jgi:hypothetical protein
MQKTQIGQFSLSWTQSHTQLTFPFIQKCDAQRPCATCVRSHANAIQTALPGAVIPERPECTYDELPESQRDREPIPERTNSAGDGGIRSRYAQLEHRIGTSSFVYHTPRAPSTTAPTATEPGQSPRRFFLTRCLSISFARSFEHSFHLLHVPSPLESRLALHLNSTN